HIKGEAIAHARFTEILYLDSDNVPVRDPTFLFDAPLYKTHGIVLWPDFVRESPANPAFRLSVSTATPRSSRPSPVRS
ncbi:hypothetical protein AB9F42_34700, partial [Rhizobium leguminosarum]|uniref:hypothetical protein n=1 Tax=Rhizobium leguminosarum TaxID=384 RepID=UPI003F9AD223